MSDQLYVTPGAQVIGRLTGDPRLGARVHVARDWEQAMLWRWQMRGSWEKQDGVWTSLGSDVRIESVGYAISEAGLEAVYADRAKLWQFIRAATSFRHFLDHWHFLDQDTGVVRRLGETIWPGQEHFAEVAAREPWVYYLKARQLGETTIAVAYDAWVLRFRTANARVHLVSRTETLAKTTLLRPLKRGLKHMPDYMKLPVAQDTTTVYELDGGVDDRRIAQAYAAKEPGRGETCSHLHLDEWAAMTKTSPELPANVWAAAEPTISKEGGTVHILTTGDGPVGFYADVWRSCIAGEGQHYACFIGASGSRPHYTPEWLKAKKAAMNDNARFAHEYPERWEDALAGMGDTYFSTAEVDRAAEDARGLMEGGCFVRDPVTRVVIRERPGYTYMDEKNRERKRIFLKAWDIGGPGEDSDASVGIALDVTDEVWDVRGFRYLKGTGYRETAWNIEALHWEFPGITIIEDNNAGLAVRSFLDIPEDQVDGFKTTAMSKGPALRSLKIALGYWSLKWKPEECAKLDAEMRTYKLKDDAIEQDCVMALAIACAKAPEAAAVTSGKVVRLFGGGLTM